MTELVSLIPNRKKINFKACIGVHCFFEFLIAQSKNKKKGWRFILINNQRQTTSTPTDAK